MTRCFVSPPIKGNNVVQPKLLLMIYGLKSSQQRIIQSTAEESSKAETSKDSSVVRGRTRGCGFSREGGNLGYL